MCERADMGSGAMLVGELPLTGQLPCLSMPCREGWFLGARQLSIAGSWGAVCSGTLAAEAPRMSCISMRTERLLLC